MRSYRNFDATTYWANKPICTVCRQRKVVNGAVCHECKKKAGWEGELVDQLQVKDFNDELLVKKFETEGVERSTASRLFQSLVGYLRDCAQAVLRSGSLVDISTADVSFLSIEPDALEQLSSDGLLLEGREAFDLLFKIQSRPTEFELILGTLFLKGSKQVKGQPKPITLNAPLVYVKIEGAQASDGKVLFTLKEDTVFLNQTLLTKVIETTDEDELDLRFQELYEAVPTWPISLGSLQQFVRSLINYFPESLNDATAKFDSFAKYEDVEMTKTEVKLCPAHAIIAAPRQETEGTVVQELTKMAEGLLNNTAADALFAEDFEDTSIELSESSEGAHGEETWHNFFPIELSDTQKNIVLAARKNMLTVVSGPPGTGKSYTTTAIILDHLLAGKRILFASRMPKAVEIIASSVEMRAGSYAVAQSGDNKIQKSLADKISSLTGPKSPVRPITKKYIDQLISHHEELLSELKRIQDDFINVLVNEREWSSIEDEIEKIEKQIKLNKNLPVLNMSDVRKQNVEGLKSKVAGAAFLLENKDFIIKTWWGHKTLNSIRKKLKVSPETSAEELVAIIEKLANKNEQKYIESEIEKFEAIDHLWSKLRSIKAELEKTALNALKGVLLGNLYQIVNNYNKRVELTTLLRALRTQNVRQKAALRSQVSTDTLLSAFPCWASTTYHLSQSIPLEPGIFDLVIFDEASQCDLASALPALYRANRALIVGDPKQLNHFTMIGKQAEFAAFAKNGVPVTAQAIYRFKSESLFDVASYRAVQSAQFILDEHFRSAPHIISFSNDKFYESSLRIMTQRPSEAEIAIEIDYVDGKRTEGAANPTEIEAIFKRVKDIIATSSLSEPITIGILCPFRDQVNAITKELPKHLTLDETNRHDIVIGTAHSLQGDEKDVVILSLSIDPKFHHGSLMFLEKPNVFNVSITRAKKKLIVVSSVRPDQLPNGLLKDFLLHADKPPANTVPQDKFDSKFEKEVADELSQLGLMVWPQFEAAGFFIDLVVGDGKKYIAIECDGPSHYDLKDRQNYHDVWRQGILERAGWRFVRIPYRRWEQDRQSELEKIIESLKTYSI